MFNHLLISLAVLLAQTTNIVITTPQPGETLRGQVEIIGNTDVPNFASAELAFSYAIPAGGASNPADSWFTIQTFTQPVANSTLVVWDTSALTDGDYVLHLRVFLQDGSSEDVVVSGLKIRNDVPLPTNTPTATVPVFLTPLLASSSIAPVTTEPVTAFPTFPSPTSLPANPVSVTSTSIYSNFARGGIITLVLFGLFSLILRLRKN